MDYFVKVPFAHKIEIIISCSWKDLERFIQEIYNKPDYDIVGNEEWDNDSEYRFDVKQSVEISLADYKKKYLFESFSLNCILQDLCNRKLIPEGTYLINVCW